MKKLIALAAVLFLVFAVVAIPKGQTMSAAPNRSAMTQADQPIGFVAASIKGNSNSKIVSGRASLINQINQILWTLTQNELECVLEWLYNNFKQKPITY